MIVSDADEGGYLGSGIWHELIVKFSDNPRLINLVEVNAVQVATDIAVTNRIATPAPLVIRGLEGEIAFGDVRLNCLPDSPNDEWTPFKFKEENFVTKGITWEITDASDLAVSGTGTLTIPLSSDSLQSVRLAPDRRENDAC